MNCDYTTGSLIVLSILTLYIFKDRIQETIQYLGYRVQCILTKCYKDSENKEDPED